MGEGFGGRVEIDVETRTAIILEVVYQAGAEGCLKGGGGARLDIFRLAGGT